MSSVPCAFELAALANAALPDLRVVGVHQPQLDNEEAQMTGLTDARGERWVVFSPHEIKTVDQLEVYGRILSWLNQATKQGFLSFRTPMPEVLIARSNNRYAMVYPDVGGAPLVEEQLQSNPLLAASLGRSLASLHNLSTLPGANSIVPVTEPALSRSRIGSLLENTRGVPERLSRRWKDAVAESTIWQFQPGFLHGNLTIEAIQSKSSVVTAITGFADACIDDPALDLQCLLPLSSDEFIDGIVEHYSPNRDGVDLHLLVRAQLYSEIAVLKWLLQGRATKNRGIIESAIEMLENLDEALDGAGLVRVQRQVHDIHFTAEDEPLVQLRRKQEEAEQAAKGGSTSSGSHRANDSQDMGLADGGVAGAQGEESQPVDSAFDDTLFDETTVTTALDTTDINNRVSNESGSGEQNGGRQNSSDTHTGSPTDRAFSHNVTREATGAYHRFTAVDTTALTIALSQLSPEEAGVDQSSVAELAEVNLAGVNLAGTKQEAAKLATTQSTRLEAGTARTKTLGAETSAETPGTGATRTEGAETTATGTTTGSGATRTGAASTGATGFGAAETATTTVKTTGAVPTEQAGDSSTDSRSATTGGNQENPAASAGFVAGFAVKRPNYAAKSRVVDSESEDEFVSEAQTAATQILHKWAEEAEAYAAEHPQRRKPNPLVKTNAPAAPFSTSVAFKVDSNSSENSTEGGSSGGSSSSNVSNEAIYPDNYGQASDPNNSGNPGAPNNLGNSNNPSNPSNLGNPSNPGSPNNMGSVGNTDNPNNTGNVTGSDTYNIFSTVPTNSSSFTPVGIADAEREWELFEAQTAALASFTADLWEIDEILQRNAATQTELDDKTGKTKN